MYYGQRFAPDVFFHLATKADLVATVSNPPLSVPMLFVYVIMRCFVRCWTRAVLFLCLFAGIVLYTTRAFPSHVFMQECPQVV